MLMYSFNFVKLIEDNCLENNIYINNSFELVDSLMTINLLGIRIGLNQ